MSKGARENRKVKRIQLDIGLRVVMCSIGADVKYELTTRNISHTGFFLEFDKPGRFPFNRSSIMEVWLELDADTKIFFNGMMARVVHKENMGEGDTTPGIAIRIVQIDKDNEEKLREFIEYKSSELKEKPVNVA